MRKCLRILGLCLILVAVFIPCVSGKAAGKNAKIVKKNDDFSVTAEYGLDGLALYRSPMQITVTVKSKENFSGMLRLLPDGSYGSRVAAYGKKITLAAGEAKTYRMTINSPNDSGYVYLSLLNDNDKVVYEEKYAPELMSIGQSVLVGVLSDDYSGVNYINGISAQYGTGAGNVSIVELNKDSFPEDVQVLKGVSYIVIDNYDTSTFSEKQYNALKRWVERGGVLILSLGSNYQNVLAGFTDDFVSGTLGDIEKKSLSWNTVDEQLTLDNVECMGFVLDGGEELNGFSNDKSAYAKRVGLGRVVVLSYSLSMEPFGSYQRKSDVVTLLLSRSVSQVTENNLVNGYSGSQVDLNADIDSIVAEDIKRPSALLYGLLLTVYVVLVGPVLYLILKKLNKREKIWIAIPIVSLVFTGIIYCTSFLYRINRPLFNSFSLIRDYDGGSYETVYSEIICPRARQYTFELSEEYDEFRFNYDQYNAGLFGDVSSAEKGEYDYLFTDNGTGTELILNSNTVFDEFKFAMGRANTEDIGNITLDLDCTTMGFTGTVTNDTAYDLSDVVVTYENHFYRAGDMKKGETVKIDPDKVMDSQGYGFFDNLYNNSHAPSYTYQMYKIDSAVEYDLVNTSEYCVGHVWGTVLSYKSELINSKQVKNSGVAVIMNDFKKMYSDVSENYYPSISGFAVDWQGDYDTEDGYMYGAGSVTITYSFDESNRISELTINRPDIEYGHYADVYAFNMNTGDFERIFENSDTLSGDELEKYMSHGIIKLRYDKEQDGNDYYIPRISAGID